MSSNKAPTLSSYRILFMRNPMTKSKKHHHPRAISSPGAKQPLRSPMTVKHPGLYSPFDSSSVSVSTIPSDEASGKPTRNHFRRYQRHIDIPPMAQTTGILKIKWFLSCSSPPSHTPPKSNRWQKIDSFESNPRCYFFWPFFHFFLHLLMDTRRGSVRVIT